VSSTLAVQPRLVVDQNSLSFPQDVSCTFTEVSLAEYSPMSLSLFASSSTDKGPTITPLRRGLLGKRKYSQASPN
jgi:hypothetical protein